jgi:hypothetical protein
MVRTQLSPIHVAPLEMKNVHVRFVALEMAVCPELAQGIGAHRE